MRPMAPCNSGNSPTMPVVRSALHSSAASASWRGSPRPVAPCSQRESSRRRWTRSSSVPSPCRKVRRPSFSSRERSGTLRSSSKRSEEHTSELQSPCNLVCRLLLEKKKKKTKKQRHQIKNKRPIDEEYKSG